MASRLTVLLAALVGLGCFEVHSEPGDASAGGDTDAGRRDPPPTGTDASPTDPLPEPEPLCGRPPCRAVRISAGSSHTCIVLESGRVGCWGANGTGQLGDGTTVDRPSPVAVPGVTDAQDVAAGRGHTCILHADGRVRCTDLDGRWVDAPVAIGRATGIAAGTGYSAAITGRGVLSWTDRGPAGWTWTSPVSEQIEGGELHVCGLSASEVWCVGEDTYGSLGAGVEASSTEPVRAALERPAVQVSAGRGHTCAVLDDGSTACWGAGWDGQLGNRSAEHSPAPVIVSGLPAALHVAANGHHTCAAAGPEGVYCWGNNDAGQAGTTPGDAQLDPVPVPRVPSARRVAIGVSHSCAVDDTGGVWCWGANRQGELGRGTSGDDWEPGLVSPGGT